MMEGDKKVLDMKHMPSFGPGVGKSNNNSRNILSKTEDAIDAECDLTESFIQKEAS